MFSDEDQESLVAAKHKKLKLTLELSLNVLAGLIIYVCFGNSDLFGTLNPAHSHSHKKNSAFLAAAAISAGAATQRARSLFRLAIESQTVQAVTQQSAAFCVFCFLPCLLEERVFDKGPLAFAFGFEEGHEIDFSVTLLDADGVEHEENLEASVAAIRAMGIVFSSVPLVFMWGADLLRVYLGRVAGAGGKSGGWSCGSWCCPRRSRGRASSTSAASVEEDVVTCWGSLGQCRNAENLCDAEGPSASRPLLERREAEVVGTEEDAGLSGARADASPDN